MSWTNCAFLLSGAMGVTTALRLMYRVHGARLGVLRIPNQSSIRQRGVCIGAVRKSAVDPREPECNQFVRWTTAWPHPDINGPSYPRLSGCSCEIHLGIVDLVCPRTRRLVVLFAMLCDRCLRHLERPVAVQPLPLDALVQFAFSVSRSLLSGKTSWSWIERLPWILVDSRFLVGILTLELVVVVFHVNVGHRIGDMAGTAADQEW